MSAKGCKAWMSLPLRCFLVFLALVRQSQAVSQQDVVLTFLTQTELVSTQGSLVFYLVLSGDLELTCNTYNCLF